MYNYKNANYHKVSALIHKFIKNSIVIEQEVEEYTPEYMKWFFDATADDLINHTFKGQTSILTTIQRAPIVHNDSKWCAVNCEDFEDLHFEIRYNLEQLNCRGNKEFRKNFIELCPMGRGFADVTLSILHEVGHHACADMEFEDYDRETELEFLHKVPREFVNFMYFMLPDELAATNWAIEWLQNADNRKRAKQFEKEFFALFKEN